MLSLASGFRLPRRWFRFLRLNFSHVWRVCIVALMLLTYVAGMWASIVSPSVAYAAALKRQHVPVVQSQSKPPRRGSHTAAYASSISPCPALTSTPKVVGNVDGLGTLGYYTLIKQNLDDRLLMATNVTNGKLVLQFNALQITGTGLNLNITFTYNSQSSASGVLGSNWNLSVGKWGLPYLQ